MSSFKEKLSKSDKVYLMQERRICMNWLKSRKTDLFRIVS